jgi:hypothetical protein
VQSWIPDHFESKIQTFARRDTLLIDSKLLMCLQPLPG